MRLVGNIDKLKQARVEGYIRYPPNWENHPITFLVDTGASNSCILPDDVAKLGVDSDTLQTVTKTIVTANGPVNLRVIQNAEIVLPVYVGLLDNKKAYLSFPMDNLAVLPPGPNFRALPPELVFSILGMDILSNFPKWIFGKEQLYMENEEVVGLKMSFKL
jgi:hypothetical protein